MSRNLKRVILLLSCTFAGLICGTLYLYSSYSPQFSQRLGYTASQSSQISIWGSIGMGVGAPISGILIDRKGYTLVSIIGFILLTSGYYIMKKQFDTEWANLSVSCACLLVIGLGSSTINSVSLKCCAVSFPSIRGVATSLPLALFGLSALFYSVIASVFFPNDTSSFFGFIMISIVLIFIACFPSIYLADCEHQSKGSTNNTPVSAQPQLPSTPKAHVKSPRTSTSEINIFTSFRFYQLFVITGMLAALGQMYIYSVGYIVKALIIKESGTSSSLSILIQQDQQFQVGILSIANFLGRIAAGVLGDIVSQSFNKPRSLLLFIPAFGMTICQIISYNIDDCTELPLVSFMIGFFYGFIFCIMPIITGDIFGMNDFSFNWGIISMSPILPSYYFIKLFGKFYDGNSTLDETNGSLVCTIGNLCYNYIFKLTLVVSISVTIIVLIFNSGDSIFRRKKAITSLPLASPTNLFNEKAS